MRYRVQTAERRDVCCLSHLGSHHWEHGDKVLPSYSEREGDKGRAEVNAFPM